MNAFELIKGLMKRANRLRKAKHSFATFVDLDTDRRFVVMTEEQFELVTKQEIIDNKLK